ncbi:CHRD domain-containing protein [Planococcus antarcticus DSM 14505]|uniref:CHRD domain-containing protein n=1 Tax=Planococcus antarcticus DSM 14505 TaxID=1185653 RepID=A0A1C7DFF9_9BACL|nr:CHRD domain-containing protein [Planococcus antarcticus]ANU10142.1 CHRD domain-containing protein [Planococcus antarcticus DSM 14505]EIM06215.1 CHRD domain-containing protein [Planococcus antarcticus DSM 14505]
MKKRMVLPLVSVLAVAGFAGSVFAAHEGQEFMAELTPDQETMEVESTATGDASVEFSEDGMSLEFMVNADDLTNTLAGHFHSGATGENGPVELLLFENAEPMDYNGEVATGTLTEADLAGDMNWEEFTAAMVAGDIYVNLHTEQYPDGEIRGQVEMAGDEMPTTATNGPLYTMIGLFTALMGGLLLFGRKQKKTA